MELKKNIEAEIIKINNLYETVNKEVIKSFEIKHAKLLKEENDLKEKLDYEVTKIKVKLGNFLSECNQIIRTNEKIFKGVQKMMKE